MLDFGAGTSDAESGSETPTFSFPDDGAEPKLTRLTWRRVSGGLLRGRLFRETIALQTRPKSQRIRGPFASPIE